MRGRKSKATRLHRNLGQKPYASSMLYSSDPGL
jgi:hypothetical protein